MNAKHHPPNIMLLCVIGMIAVLALIGAIVFGYKVSTKMRSVFTA